MNETIHDAIVAACETLYGSEVATELTIPDASFGDVTSNIALRLASELQRPPREIAQEIAGALQDVPFVESVGVAGPGFINITLTDDALFEVATTNPPKPYTGMKIVVEYSDPNPFKPLHAGHLYTTIVGDVIARLVERAGADTIRLNYGGDVGLHVGRTMWAMIRNLGGENITALRNIPDQELGTWLGERYAEGYKAYNEDELAKAEIIELNKKVYALHASNDHDSPFAQLYWYAREKSYSFFKQLYDSLQVAAFDRFIPESEVTPLGVETVESHQTEGVFKQSNGAVVFEGEPYGLHTRVFINSEGLPTYETKDVGLSLTKWQDYAFDESIIITANEQAQYMQVVLKAIEQFAPEASQRTKHLTHGMVKLAGGVKMSSRLGNVISAQSILEAAREAGNKSGNATNDSIILAAVKYAFLKHRVGGDIVYDPQESIALEGNSGPYLQYAHARAQSILRKGHSSANALNVSRLETDERLLLRKISHFHVAVDRATQELAPHHLCTYLYELSQEFNRFYEKNKVIGHDREYARLKLVSLYAQTLKDGLAILGIIAPDEM